MDIFHFNRNPWQRTKKLYRRSNFPILRRVVTTCSSGALTGLASLLTKLTGTDIATGCISSHEANLAATRP